MTKAKKQDTPKRRLADLHPELAESAPRQVRKNRAPAPRERGVREPTYLERIRAKIVARGKQKYLGFTLTELIVTVSIIATLGTISSVSVMGVFGSARDSVRVTDMSNMKNALNLYHTLNGSYPKPSNATAVSYSGATAWMQGTFWESVIMQVGGDGMIQISAKPVDPLLKTEYIYSLTTESKEYSLMSNYEGDSLSLMGDIVSDTYAASGDPQLAYVQGTYNGVIARVNTGGVINFLTVPNIVTTSGVTIVNTDDPLAFMLHGQSNSGVLFTPKVAYSGSSFPNDTDERMALANGIISAYSGTSLEQNEAIEAFVSAADNPSALENLSRDLITQTTGGDTDAQTVTSTPAPTTPTAPTIPAYDPSTTYDTGESFVYSGVTVTVSGTWVGLADSKADPFCNTNDTAIWTGSSVQIWASCNVGGGIKYNPSTDGWSGTLVDAVEANRIAAYSGIINSANNFLGGYYQWGRNDPVSLLATGSVQYPSGYAPGGITLGSGSGFILWMVSAYSWVIDASHNSSSGTVWTNTSLNGLCPNGYHVPTGGTADTTTEWGTAFTIAGSGQTTYSLGTCSQTSGYDRLRCALALPLVGARTSTTGVYGNQGSYGHYWSSSPVPGNAFAYYAQFSAGGGTIAKTNGRSGGFSVRCIKN